MMLGVPLTIRCKLSYSMFESASMGRFGLSDPFSTDSTISNSRIIQKKSDETEHPEMPETGNAAPHNHPATQKDRFLGKFCGERFWFLRPSKLTNKDWKTRSSGNFPFGSNG